MSTKSTLIECQRCRGFFGAGTSIVRHLATCSDQGTHERRNRVIAIREPERWPLADFCAMPITRYAGQEIA